MVKTFFLPLAAALCLTFSIFDCYHRKGKRLTFNFFFFSFLYLSGWIFKNIGNTPLPLKTARSLSHSFFPVGLAEPIKSVCIFVILLTGVSVFMCIYYVGWRFSEDILQRASIFKGRIFASVLMTGLVAVSFLYILESLAINMGWWRWDITALESGDFLVCCPLHPLREGFYNVVYFISAYLLIECSEYRKRTWKMIFFILPFIHIWTIRFFGDGLPRFIERSITLTTLVVLAYISSVRLEYADNPLRKNSKIETRPRIFLWYMLITVAVIWFIVQFVIIKNSPVAISLLPAFFFLLLSSKSIPIYLVIIFSCLFLVILGYRYIFILVPLVASLSFIISAYSEK